MGAGQSSEKPKRTNNNLTKDEVERILEEQRKIFEQKYKELLKTTKGVNEAFLAEQTREEARKEVERILNQNRAQATSSTSFPVSPVKNLERQRTPYSFSQNDLHIGVAQPTATNLYPNLIENNGNPNHNFPPHPLSSQQRSNSPMFPAYSKTDFSGNNSNPKTGSANPTVTNAQSSSVNSNVKTGYANPTVPNAHSSSVNSNAKTAYVNPTVNNAYSPLVYYNSNVGSNPMVANANSNNVYAGNLNNRKVGGVSDSVPSAPPAPRDRSASRTRKNKPRGNSKINDDNELDCPTCKQKFTINIYQCSKGHSSCSNCRARMACCGICRLPITDIRNRALEEYISERKVRCPNSKDGCCLFIKMAELEIHGKECPFKEMKCPLADIFGQCTWRGKLPQMASHFDDVHPMHRQSTVDSEMSLLNFRYDNQVVYFVTIGSFNFLFHLRVSESNRMIYMTVQLIGTNHSADKWNYEIHVYNKSQPRKKYQYVDICHSDKTSLNEIVAQGKCAMIPFSYAENFINNNRLTYKFYIKREAEANKSGKEGARRRC